MPRAKFAETEGYTAFMLGTGVEMMPGTSRLVELAAIGSSKFVSNVQIGAQFSIHEGPAQVGQGTVYSIIAGPADRFVG